MMAKTEITARLQIARNPRFVLLKSPYLCHLKKYHIKKNHLRTLNRNVCVTVGLREYALSVVNVFRKTTLMIIWDFVKKDILLNIKQSIQPMFIFHLIKSEVNTTVSCMHKKIMAI